MHRTVFHVLVILGVGVGAEEDEKNTYLNEWAVHVPRGRIVADAIAAEHGMVNLGEIIPDSDHYHFIHNNRPRRSLDEDHHVQKKILKTEDVKWAAQQKENIRTKRAAFRNKQRSLDVYLNDPMWNKMWYLNRDNGFHMNVVGAWQAGVTGRGVAVTILDDGIEKDHPDLIRNYDPLASTDINDNDSDPNPRYDFSDSNRHGTRCAGQVAAAYNNSLCSVGIAFNAQIGGVRMLDGQVSDAVEARSLSFNPDHIDIYSSSWGPNDDGKTVDGPGKLAQRAFKNGITRGRDGKGSIFVWASGNGGRYKDNCNCDGYATSIYTVTVSSASEYGQIPWYSEACSSTLATTYSSGTTSEQQIVTTDLHHGCTLKHTGTSASAPMAAGIIALALEANPSLTWRDVQHIIVRTSRPVNLKAMDWNENALGRKVSHNYGYGLMDANAMVMLARNWTTMPEQNKCTAQTPYYFKVIPAMGQVTIDLEVTKCPGVKYLEHVISPIHVSSGRKRGDLRIYLTSPSGTRSTLLDARPQDFSSSGFVDWPFMTVHSWGENPIGKWTLEIHNDAYSKWASDAKFFKWSLDLMGTEFDPNSEEYREAFAEKNNVVGDISSRSLDSDPPPPQAPPSDLPSEPPTDPPLIKRGCVSKESQCSQDSQNCRSFSHRRVAELFCKCTNLCLEVASSPNVKGEDEYNLQCDMEKSKRRLPSSDSETPFYCQFIPFMSQ